MGSKITKTLFDRHAEDNIKFTLYMFMMKLIGSEIYRRSSLGLHQDI